MKGHFLSVKEFWLALITVPFDNHKGASIPLVFFASHADFEPHSQLLVVQLSSKFAQHPKTFQEFAHTDVLALNGGLGGTETQTNILVPSSLYKSSVVILYSSQLHIRRGSTHATLARTLGLALGDKRNVRLLLESTLRLDGQLGSHVCGCCRSQKRAMDRALFYRLKVMLNFVPRISKRHLGVGCRKFGVAVLTG